MFQDSNTHSISIRLSDTMDVNSVTQTKMNIPTFIIHLKNLITWNWTKMHKQLDWGYPMAMTGTIFRKDDLLPLLSQLNYHNSGRLESQMNHHRLNKSIMAAVNKCCVVDLPFNAILTEANNPHSDIPIDYLNKKYLYDKTLSMSVIDNIDVTHSFMTYGIEPTFEG